MTGFVSGTGNFSPLITCPALKILYVRASLDAKKLSEDIKAVLPGREINSGDTREIRDIISTSFDALKSPDTQ